MPRRLIFFILVFFSLFLSSTTTSYAQNDKNSGCCEKTEIATPNRVTTMDSDKATCDLTGQQGPWTVRFMPDHFANANTCEKKAAVNEQKSGDPIVAKPSVSIPDSKYIAGQEVEIEESTSALANYIIAIFKYSTGVIGIIAAIVLMMAGIIWITAAGNQEQIGSAKKMIGGGLMGLVLTFSAFIILAMVNTNLVNLKITPVTKIQNISLDELEDVCALKTAQDDTTTSQNMSRKACEELIANEVEPNNADKYKKVECKPYSNGGWVAENNTCVQTAGCCLLDIGSQFGLFEWPWGDDQICIQELTEKSCDKNATSALSNYIPGYNFFANDIDADHYRGQKCEAISDCTGNLICDSAAECFEKLKLKNQSEN